MTVALAGRSPATFEIKSANLPLVSLLLKSTDLATLTQELKDRFGDKLVVRTVAPSQGWGLKRLGFGVQVPDIAGNTVDALETRAMWSRFGL